MSGHEKLNKNKQVEKKEKEEDNSKSYVPLRGGASRTH